MLRARAELAGGVTLERLNRVGRLLSEIAHSPAAFDTPELRAMHGTDSGASVLQTDADGLTLVLGKFSHRAETPIHDHNCWGVACVVAGRDRYRHWRRTDPGNQADRASLSLAFERELAAGDSVSWLGPPGDIHSQQGIEEPAWELILFGCNAMSLPRRYYDLTTGRVRTALPV